MPERGFEPPRLAAHASEACVSAISPLWLACLYYTSPILEYNCSMKLIIGLGNPGKEYEQHRHNIGYMVIDALEKAWEAHIVKKNHSILSTIIEVNIDNERVLLVKPLTFMNNSGEAASTLSRFYKVDLEDIVVIHDDLDLPLGQVKVAKGVGPKGHNGIVSVEQMLKNHDFWRVRMGIENRDTESKVAGEAYVLGDFTKEENRIVAEMLHRAVVEIEKLV